MPIPNEATKEVIAFKRITRQLLRYYGLHYALDNRMSVSPERDLISRSRDFRRDMVSIVAFQS